MTIMLTPEELRIVRHILQQFVPQFKVLAFGSRVKNNAKPYSDLDLAIMTDTPLDLATQADLAEAFSESDLPWKVDIVDWTGTSPAFKEIIMQCYEVVQHAQNEVTK
ncbi:nucleotidyltransferase domain-containing protein [Pasteurellaceae bacterium LIM206]|nr:nucleotidyltransferase domain-containing protein [Pasteurellaceae bacterium LIM206]